MRYIFAELRLVGVGEVIGHATSFLQNRNRLEKEELWVMCYSFVKLMVINIFFSVYLLFR